MADGFDDALYQSAQEDSLPPDQALAGLAAAARGRREVAARLMQLEGELGDTKALLRQYDEVMIPDLMSSIGMATFELDDGTTVKVAPFVDVSVREDDRPAAWEWLDQQGFGDIVKHEVSVALGKGDGELADAAVQALENMGLSVRDRLSVHPGTLKAFVSEQIKKAAEQGVAPIVFPPEFNIFQGRRARLSMGR
ncbi:hypothetical protein UFOVP1287_2 [uncultured Caudovirales phage]|uniref:Uncharacterized protein n=1 Tax=uncultured Caudovirales phage TaxID=2100421 RepID=A0A6J5S8I1_9CAUD|nr:hypothetical protein UFOVP1287_2 [uncultured Caudovirales phage]CAB4205190.1 hypothetical protein UFOVP1408_38 [uncultured Caudovirales phage]